MCHASRHHHAHRQPVSRDERQREFVQRATMFGIAFTVCVAIWMITGFSGFWPAWVLLIGGFVLAKEAREAYGADDDEDLEATLDDVSEVEPREPVLR